VKWLRWGGAVLVLGAVLVTAWRLTLHDRPTAAEYRVPGARVPYTLEVLNGTDVDGLAFAVTLRLRRAGLDVVSYGTAQSEPADSTLLLVRSADTAAGWAVRDALGFGRVVVEPDARLLLDVTVLLGRDAVPSPDPER
jgi:LytR cell envelope-related transcriptional attenuator